MANEPDIREGATDSETGGYVTYLQQLLGGLYTGTVDGIFGPITDGAVRAHQEQHGLVVDGWVGPVTWPTLTGEAAGGEGDVPADLVAAGAPPRLADWTEEQRQAYFTGSGSEPIQQVDGDSSEEIEVLAIADTPEDEGEALA
ncbi:MAG: peptidoglycan-binding protein [Actinomycetota bacterium]|nr:peptidoglycan-binding protein [Actinomycetota bacterium]